MLTNILPVIQNFMSPRNVVLYTTAIQTSEYHTLHHELQSLSETYLHVCWRVAINGVLCLEAVIKFKIELKFELFVLSCKS